jgi:type I restriction enzyme S subunit
LKSGGTPSKENSAYWNGDIPWASAKDLKSDNLEDTVDHITRSALEDGVAQLIVPGSVVVLVRGMMLARTFPVCRTGVPMAINQDLKAIEGRPGVRNDFLAWLLRGAEPETLNRLDEAGHGTKALRMETWLSMPTPQPTLQEQGAIAAFLDRETAKIDALVEEQRRLIELLKEKRQAVISHAVTKGLDLTAPMKDSSVELLGEVPAHWRVTPLKYVLSLRSGGTPSKDRIDYWSGDIPWASAKDLKAETLADTIDHTTEIAVAEGAVQMNPRGSVLVLVRGMMLARAFPVVTIEVAMAINQDLKAINGRGGLSNEYLAWLLRGTAEESLNRLDEAGHGTKALRMEAWLSIQVPIPPPPEQSSIVCHLAMATQRIDDLIREAASAIALLQERRVALISAAVTGKIDVRQKACCQDAAA